MLVLATRLQKIYSKALKIRLIFTKSTKTVRCLKYIYIFPVSNYLNFRKKIVIYKHNAANIKIMIASGKTVRVT